MSEEILKNKFKLSNNYNRKIKKGTKEYQFIVKEKGYSAYLITLGKIAGFMKELYEETIDKQYIKFIVPLEDPTEEESYKEGYRIAMALVNNGFTKENFKNFLKNLNPRIKEKVVEIEKINDKMHR